MYNVRPVEGYVCVNCDSRQSCGQSKWWGQLQHTCEYNVTSFMVLVILRRRLLLNVCKQSQMSNDEHFTVDSWKPLRLCLYWIFGSVMVQMEHFSDLWIFFGGGGVGFNLMTKLNEHAVYMGQDLLCAHVRCNINDNSCFTAMWHTEIDVITWLINMEFIHLQTQFSKS